MFLKTIILIFTILLLINCISTQTVSPTEFLPNFIKNHGNPGNDSSKLRNLDKNNEGDGGIKFVGVHATFLNLWWCIGADSNIFFP